MDLALSELGEGSIEALIGLAKRVKQLNLDGTKLTALQPSSLGRLLDSAPDTTFFLAGTGLSARQLVHPRAEWLAPDVVACLEDQPWRSDSLTPERPHDGFEAPAWPSLGAYLRHELLGWSRVDGSPVEDRALLLLDGEVWKFSAVAPSVHPERSRGTR